MSETTSYYRCTKCKLQTDPYEYIDMTPNPARTAGINVRQMQASLCCNAPVQVVSDKRP